jgi:hypothetical protein
MQLPSEEQFSNLYGKALKILDIIDAHTGYESPDGGTCVCSTTCGVCLCLYAKEIEEFRKALVIL